MLCLQLAETQKGQEEALRMLGEKQAEQDQQQEQVQRKHDALQVTLASHISKRLSLHWAATTAAALDTLGTYLGLKCALNVTTGILTTVG